MLKRVLFVGAAIVLLVLGYLLSWPVDIDPIAWEAPVLDESAWTPKVGLDGASRVTLADGVGPEDVDCDTEGRVYGGLEDGRIVRWDPEGQTQETVADTQGRPLGLDWDAQDRLVIADADRGLLRLSADGTVETLTTTCGSTPLVFTDDVEVAPDGALYFTDASVRFSLHRWRADIIEGRGNGRLCRYREGESGAEELLAGLYFANGVAIAEDGSFLLVNETSRYRVRKYWLTGARAGEDEVVIDNLPGFPDGISAGTRGTFWIAVASPRDATLDALAGSPGLRRVVQRLPEFLKPAAKKTARVLGISGEGEILHDLFDPQGHPISVVTSVQERAGRLYLGSLSDTAWASLPRP